MFNTRYFNNIYDLWNNIIKKTSENNKIISEYNWFINVKDKIPNHIPKIYDFLWNW